MIKSVLIFLFCCVHVSLLAQLKAYTIWNLADKAETGDREALEELIHLSGRKKKIEYMFGRHWRREPMGHLALFNLWKICSFTDVEATALIYANEKKQSSFFKSKMDSLHYSSAFQCWTIQPLENRTINYELIELTPGRLTKLKSDFADLYVRDSVLKFRIDSLYAIRDPKVLLELSKKAFKTRMSFDSSDDFCNSICALTGYELKVQKSNGDFTEHVGIDHHDVGLANYLAFWIQHYASFSWNEEKGIFESQEVQTIPQTELSKFYERIGSSNDSIARAAYKELVDSGLKIEYEVFHQPHANSRVIPYSWDDFARVIRSYQTFLEQEEVKVELSVELRTMITELAANLTFKERYALENRLIEELDLNSICAFEIEILYTETNDPMQYSAGRIIDKFYSQHWNEIITDSAQLKRYLKKTELFDRLGVHGVATSLVNKFDKPSPELKKQLKAILSTTTDPKIKEQIKEILETKNYYTDSKLKPPGENAKDFKTKEELNNALANYHGPKNDSLSGTYSSEYLGILHKIPYALLPGFIASLDTVEFSTNYRFWDFYHLQFTLGIPVDCLDDKACRDELQLLLATKSIKEVQLYYLKEQGMDIQTTDGKLDFEKIADILKYDFPIPFAGGSTPRYFGSFACIKLLESEFGTRLGFPEEVTTIETSAFAGLMERTDRWQIYLREHNLIAPDPEPISVVQAYDWYKVKFPRRFNKMSQKRYKRRFKRQFKRR